MLVSKKGFFFIYTVLFIFFSFSLFTFSPYFFAGTGASSDGVSGLVVFVHFVPGILFLLFGWGAYLFIVLGLLVYSIFFDSFSFLFMRRKFVLGFVLLVFSLLFAMVVFTGDKSFSGGGILFGMLDDFMRLLFGIFGELFVLLLLLLSSFLLLFGISFSRFISIIFSFFGSMFVLRTFSLQDGKPPLIGELGVEDSVSSGGFSGSDDVVGKGFATVVGVSGLEGVSLIGSGGRGDRLDEGLDKSLDEGLDKSLDEGLDKSLDEGLDKSLDEGLDKSLDEGLDDELDANRRLSIADIVDKEEPLLIEAVDGGGVGVLSSGVFDLGSVDIGDDISRDLGVCGGGFGIGGE